MRAGASTVHVPETAPNLTTYMCFGKTNIGCTGMPRTLVRIIAERGTRPSAIVLQLVSSSGMRDITVERWSGVRISNAEFPE